MEYGILSLLPVCVALVLAFVTKDALLSILIGVLTGIIVSGQNIVTGFTGILQSALGNADFIWILAIEVFVGIVVAYFQKAGALEAFANMLSKHNLKRKGATILSSLLGIFIFFSDYFSSLYVGSIMRPITDKSKVSREMLAYDQRLPASQPWRNTACAYPTTEAPAPILATETHHCLTACRAVHTHPLRNTVL